MALRGFLKTFTGDSNSNNANPEKNGSENEVAKTEESGVTNASNVTDSSTNSGGIGSGFFSGTSKFFDSVSAKKDGLLNDISSKLGGLKMGGNEKQNDDGDSSASEYGDGGDKPFYAEEVPEERRGSMDSVDSLPENEAEEYRGFITSLVGLIFDRQSSLKDAQKSQFQAYCQHHTGRSWFAKEALKQREIQKAVSEEVLHKLTDCMALALYACNSSDDFGPARILMNLCFTFYVDRSSHSGGAKQYYLYMNLHEQPIWQSLRFWNAAFFDALYQERKKKTENVKEDDEGALEMEKEFQENLNFSLLSQYSWNMASLGLGKDVCIEFLRKQSSVAAISKEKGRIIRNNIIKWTTTPQSNEGTN